MRRGPGVAPPAVPPASEAWLELDERRLAISGDGMRLALDVQGLHCSGCIWLVEKLFHRYPGASRIITNSAIGRMDLLVEPSFPLREWVQQVERFGYRLGPARKGSSPAANATLIRLGVTSALAANSMIFAAALYLGSSEGTLTRLFELLELALASLAVVVGGEPFFRSAFASLRRGVAHMDVPIALAIGLGFVGSSWGYFTDRPSAIYLDSLTVFIALMLAGRYLHESLLAKHRRFLLEDPGLDGVVVRRLGADGPELVACGAVRAGDRLLVAPGELCFVAARVASDAATLALEWIDGESEPRSFVHGAHVPAGAHNVGDEVLHLQALEDLESSAVLALLNPSALPVAESEQNSTSWWQRLSTAYVVTVVALASGGFAAWYLASDVTKALEVTTAVLVVTCPCAFGIATPLAYELAQSGLRRAGLVVRRAGLLDRLLDVRRVVFDKTGTLTTGSLTLRDAAPLRHLDETARDVLFTLTSQSSHPKSAALKAAMLRSERPPTYLPGVTVRQTAGRGMEGSHDGHTYRLGAPGWADRAGEGFDQEPSPGLDLVYCRNGQRLATFGTEEEARPGTREELAELQGQGLDVWILSGDQTDRTRRFADQVGLASERALGDRSPRDKEAFLARYDRSDTLTIGDGVNDSLAIARSHCSGTPAIERPFVPARTDFYLVTTGLAPVGRALRVARALRSVVYGNLAFATAYNTLAVGLALAGVMKPWIAAVLMPISSLTVVTLTSWRLSGRAPLWK